MDNISEFIKNNPQKAQAYAIEWQEAARKYFFPAFATKKEWIDWLSTSKIDLPQDLWVGNEILQALNTVTLASQPETPPEPTPQSNPLSLLGAALIPFAFRSKPELMEDDSRFKKIEEDLKKEWLKNNPSKDFSGKEGLDYLHGNLDDPDAPTLKSDAEKAFREKNPKKATYYDKRAKKIYKNSDEDPAIARARRDIDEHIRARRAYFEKNGIEENFDGVEKKIKDQEWDRFIKRYEIKARGYRENLPDLDRALDRGEIRQKLLEYKESTGKEIKYTEKLKREAPKVSVEDATKRLKGQLKKEDAERLATEKARTDISRVSRESLAARARTPFGTIGTRAVSFGQRGTGFAGQAAQGAARAGIRGAGMGARAGAMGARAATQAVLAAARIVPLVAATPVGWIAAAIGIVILIILIIIFFFGGGGGFGLPSIPGLGGGGGGPGGGPGGPGTPITRGLNYYIPFRDPTVVPQDIKSVVLSSWPNAQIDNWDIIVSEAVANDWNPAMLLALWIEESGAQGVPAADPLGCLDPSNIGKNDIHLSLQCVFGSFDLTYDRFNDFMCRYSDGYDAPCTFATNPNFPPNIRSWYEKLVPEGSYGALVDVSPTPVLISASCPIAQGAPAVSCGSLFNERKNCGHCNTEYKSAHPNLCTYDLINYAEDIAGPAGEPVYLPTVNGETIVWTRVRITSSSIGYIRYYSGVGETSGNRFWLQFHHVDRDVGALEGVSGDKGAQICTTDSRCNHVHVEFAKVVSGGGMNPVDAAITFCL